MTRPKLFMVLIGCTPKGRNTEQHDMFFGIAEDMKNLLPNIINFWPEAEGKMHIDAWREVNVVNGFNIEITEKAIPEIQNESISARLFFINLGGYKENEFDEFHYKLLFAAADKAEAIKLAKQTAFYKHVNFPGAESHIDDKFGVDVDDIHQIEDILSAEFKSKYSIRLSKNSAKPDDKIHLGYFKLSSF